MSKGNEMGPPQLQSPMLGYDKTQPPPAYDAQSQPATYQQGYPPQGMPPQAGYPMAQPQHGYIMAQPHPGMGQQPAHYQYGNVIVQQPVYQTTAGPPPPDQMTGAILATLCCFWPTGIIAIMRASDARSAASRGDYAAANAAANSAKSMIKMSVIIGIIVMVFMCVFLGIYFGFIIKKLNDINDDYSY